MGKWILLSLLFLFANGSWAADATGCKVTAGYNDLDCENDRTTNAGVSKALDAKNSYCCGKENTDDRNASGHANGSQAQLAARAGTSTPVGTSGTGTGSGVGEKKTGP